MKKLTKNRNVLGNALVWASMMIAMGLLTRGTDNSQMLLLMIAGWLTTHSLMSGDEHKAIRCIRESPEG